MRVLVPVLVIAIVAITALLIIRSVNRTADRKKQLSNVLLERNQLRGVVSRIDHELAVQLTAGYFDPQPLQNIINDYEKDRITK